MALMPVIKIASRPTQPASGETDIREIKIVLVGREPSNTFAVSRRQNN
jgi:hypothetical protein